MNANSFPDFGVYPGRLCQFLKGDPKPRKFLLFFCEGKDRLGVAMPAGMASRLASSWRSFAAHHAINVYLIRLNGEFWKTGPVVVCLSGNSHELF